MAITTEIKKAAPKQLKLDPDVPLLLVELGYSAKFVVPWAVGIEIFHLLAQGTPVETEGYGSDVRWKKASDTPTLRGLTPVELASMLMDGIA